MAKCKLCKKDYDEGVKAAYKLGMLEGEKQLTRTVNVVKITNKYLMEELLRLDYEKSLLGDPNHVKIIFKLNLLKKIAQNLYDAEHTSQAAILRRHIKKHLEKQAQFYAILEQELRL